MGLLQGGCGKAEILPESDSRKPAFVLTSSYGNSTSHLKGELDPMQAMLTRKLHVQSNMGYLMRSGARFPGRSLPGCPAAGYVPDLDSMLGAYYRVRGWDEGTGHPTRERLLAFGLGQAARDLWG